MIAVFSMMMITCVAFSGSVQAGTIYEYTDRYGSVVLTDSPPPGVKARPLQTYQDMTETDKGEMAKEKAEQMEKYRSSDVKRNEKEEKIRAAREEYEQALKDEERYRANKNQASGYVQQRRWIKEIEAQDAKIEEKKTKLQELESEP